MAALTLWAVFCFVLFWVALVVDVAGMKKDNAYMVFGGYGAMFVFGGAFIVLAEIMRLS